MKSKDKIYGIANAALRGASLTMEEIETVSKVSPMALIADHGFAIEEAHMIINNMTIQARKHKALGFRTKPIKEGKKKKINHSIDEAFTLKDIALGAADVALGAVGFIPGLGEIANAAQVALAASQGDYLGAGLSLISMIPEVGDVVGQGGKALLWAEKNFGKGVVKAATSMLPKIKGLAKIIEEMKDEVEKILNYAEGIDTIKTYVPKIREAIQNFVRDHLTTSESKRISRLPAHLQGPLRKALIECGCQDAEEPEMSFPFPAPQMSSYHPVETDDGLQFEDSDAYEESGMIKSNLYSITTKAQSLHDMVEDGDDLPEWVQEKIAVCDEYMDVIQDYLKYEYKTTGGHLGRSKSK